jgi:hypothetical protein
MVAGMICGLLFVLAMHAGTYFMFRLFTDSIGKTASMFVSALLAVATWEAIGYFISPAMPEDQRLYSGLCIAALQPMWMAWDIMRNPTPKNDAHE